MDRLVRPEVKEVELSFKGDQRCSAIFKLTNLMHTMPVAVSLTTTNPDFFSFAQSFSILPPLSSAVFTLVLSQPRDHPPLSSPPDSVVVRSSMLPTGKAHQDDLRRLFSKPGRHVFRDASLPICFVGPRVVEFLLSPAPPYRALELAFLLKMAISGCDKSQLTPLLKSAVTQGNAESVSALIDGGADPSDVHPDGRSLVSLAVRSGYIDVVRILIASGCRVDNSVDYLLHDAAAMNRVDLMEVLCSGYVEIDVNSADSNGRTALHLTAIHAHIEALEFCLNRGGNPDASDADGWTPLHCAASKGHMETVESLLNCSIYAKFAVNKDGKTAYALAVDNGHSHLFDLLHLGEALQRAARADDINGVKGCLAEGTKVNGRDQNGWTPLHRAAFKGRLECVKLLLDHGARVDLIDDAGYTPLHCAVEAGHVQVALFLIAHGGRANLKSLKGAVPLNLDCFKSHPSLAFPLCQEQEQA